MADEVKTTFTDAKGRKWPLAVNIGTARDVKNKCDIDLLKFFADQKESEKLADPYKLAEVLYVLSGAEKKNVEEIDFLESLTGEVPDAAALALMESLVLFFPSRKAQALRRLLDKIMSVENLKTEALFQEVEKMTVDFGQPSISLPESSESSPTV